MSATYLWDDPRTRDPGRVRRTLATGVLVAVACVVEAPEPVKGQDGPREPQTVRLFGAAGAAFLQPTFRSGGLSVTGVVGAASGGGWRTEGSLGAMVPVPLASGLGLALRTGAYAADGRSTATDRGTALDGRLVWGGPRTGGSVGGGIARHWRGPLETDVRDVAATLWHRDHWGSIEASGRFARFDQPSTVERVSTYDVAGYTFTSHRQEAYLASRTLVEGELRFSPSFGPVPFSVTVGHRRGWGVASRWWAYGTLELPVAEWLTPVVSVGVQPGVPEQGIEAGAFLSVGFRWWVGGPRGSGSGGAFGGRSPMTMSTPPTPRMVAFASGAEGAWVRLLGVKAKVVELMGDVTDWTPISLVETGPGAWRLPDRVPSGLYAVVIRVDAGTWEAPPGLPVQSDEFGGEVGLLLVESDAGSGKD